MLLFVNSKNRKIRNANKQALRMFFIYRLMSVAMILGIVVANVQSA